MLIVLCGDAMLGNESEAKNRLLFRIVLLSFLVELLLAEGWLRLARQGNVGSLLANGSNLGTALVAGLVLGAAILVGSRLFFSTFARGITRELLVPLFGGVTYVNIVLMSLLPGLGEEILFRGTLQPEIGLGAASLVFGLLHSGFSRQLLPYGLWAALVGALLGGLYLWTGNLWGNVVAHALTNLTGMLWIRQLALRAGPAEEEAPGGDGAT